MSGSIGHWEGWPSCPCGCGVEGMKLQLRNDHHIVACECGSCRGRRNVRKGKAAHAKMHRNLGGTGFTPGNEESARVYPPVLVMPESKTGGQVPRHFHTFIATDWFRRALNQNERGLPIGSGCKPSVVIDGRWLIVDTSGGIGSPSSKGR